MLIHLKKSTHSVLFRPQDVVRLTPIFVAGKVDFYLLELKNFSQSIDITLHQFNHLIDLLPAMYLPEEDEQTDLIGADFTSEPIDPAVIDSIDTMLDDLMVACNGNTPDPFNCRSRDRS
jgi:hypothetical protein